MKNLKIKKEIKISKNGEYKIDFLNCKIEKIKIIIKENLNVKIFSNINNKNLKIDFDFQILNNSKLKLIQFIKNIKSKNTNLNIYENCNVKNLVFYDLKNCNCKNLSKVIHKEKNSKSKIEIFGICKKNSNIEFNTFCKVLKKAINIETSQKTSNINLCENSIITGEPILEIENNKVISSHKCKIENIDKKKLFYLNSRGINKNQIIDLYKENFITYCVDGFYGEIDL